LSYRGQHGIGDGHRPSAAGTHALYGLTRGRAPRGHDAGPVGPSAIRQRCVAGGASVAQRVFAPSPVCSAPIRTQKAFKSPPMAARAPERKRNSRPCLKRTGPCRRRLR